MSWDVKNFDLSCKYLKLASASVVSHGISEVVSGSGLVTLSIMTLVALNDRDTDSIEVIQVEHI